MCGTAFIPDERKLSLQIKSAFSSFMNRVKLFMSGKNAILAKSNDYELARRPVKPFSPN